MKIYVRTNLGDADAKHGRLGIKISDHYIQDIRKLLRMGTNLTDLSKVIDSIRTTPNYQDLPSTYQAHKLTGKYKYKGTDYGRVIDVHIKGNLILLYKIEGNILHCVRVGTHSDLKIGSSYNVPLSLIYI